MEIERELIMIEEHFWRAAGDSDDYAKRLAADAVHVFPGWGVVDRDEVLAAVAEAEPWKTFSMENTRVVVVSDDTAAVIYRAHAEREAPYDAAITSVYRRRDGEWALVLHQQTPLAGHAASKDCSQ